MKTVLDQGPDEDTQTPVTSKNKRRAYALASLIGAVDDAGHPEGWNNPPRGLCERFQEVSEQRRGLASLVVAGAMDLVEVEVLAEATKPDLREQRTAKIEELVLLIILVVIRLFAEVLFARHAGSGMDSGIVFGLGGDGFSVGFVALCRHDEANVVIVEDLVGGLGVEVRGLVVENVLDIATSIIEDQAATTGVIVHELGHIIDVGADGHIA